MKRVTAILLLIACAAGIGGCSQVRPAPTQATGQAIARAQVRGEAISYHAGKIIPKTKGEVQVHAQSIAVEAEEQRKDLAEADARNVAAGEQANAAAKELAEIKSGAFYRFGVAVSRIWGFVWRWSLWILVGSVVLRGVALAFPGPIGAVLSIISTAGLGILTAGISLVQAGADNAFFRFIRPKQKIKKFVETGGGVSSTTTAAGTVTVVGNASGTDETIPPAPEGIPAAQL